MNNQRDAVVVGRPDHTMGGSFFVVRLQIDSFVYEVITRGWYLDADLPGNGGVATIDVYGDIGGDTCFVIGGIVYPASVVTKDSA